MSRLDRAQIIASLSGALSATPDPEGVADLVSSRGKIGVAGSAAEMAEQIARLKPLMGYRWLAINADDLFAASMPTLGTKIGIMDPTGRVLKAADLPRAK